MSGDTLSVSPQAVGHQAHLADDEGAQEIYVDQDLTHWTEPSAQRQINMVTGSLSLAAHSVAPDVSNGAPALITAYTDPWSTTSLPISEALYDAKGIGIGSIYYAWKRGALTGAGPSNYDWRVYLGNTDTFSSLDNTGDLQAAGPSTGTLTATTASRKFAAVLFQFVTTAATSTNFTYEVYWTSLAICGTHGLTKRGTASTTAAQGFYASDVIANAVSRWAPRLRFTTGAQGTIAPTTFVIPQLEFRDRTTVDVIIKEADRFHLRDWAVWEGSQPNQPTFYYQDRGARGRRWRARVRPAKLEETGPQLDKLFNGVYVRYTDAAGTSFTVGPTGTSADTTSDELLDSDPLNPANQVGIKRYTTLDMGIMSTAEAATEVGRRFLEEAKLHDKSGSAEIVGHVEDDRGVIHPAWAVRAGDEISFTDAADPSYRRIVRTSYEHDSRSNSLDLDSPPEGLDSLLERLGVAIAPGASGGGAGSGATPAQNRPSGGGGSDRPTAGGGSSR